MTSKVKMHQNCIGLVILIQMNQTSKVAIIPALDSETHWHQFSEFLHKSWDRVQGKQALHFQTVRSQDAGLH